jgi:DNA-binding transcriptional MerR regulator
MKRKPVPQSLYQSFGDAPTVDEDLRRAMEENPDIANVAVAGWALKEIEAFAEGLTSAPSTTRSLEYAEQMRQQVAAIREQLLQIEDAGGDTNLAAGKFSDGLRLGSVMEAARADAMFAKPVRDEQRKLKGLIGQAKRPDPEVISAAIKSTANRTEAAKKLGVPTRTLRRWISGDFGKY